MSTLMKIHQLTTEILSPQVFHIWPHMTLTFDLMTLNTKAGHLPFMVINHVKFGEDPSTHFREIVPTSFSYMTSYELDLWPHNIEYLINLSTLHGK